MRKMLWRRGQRPLHGSSVYRFSVVPTRSLTISCFVGSICRPGWFTSELDASPQVRAALGCPTECPGQNGTGIGTLPHDDGTPVGVGCPYKPQQVEAKLRQGLGRRQTMSAPAAAQQPAPHSALRRLVARHPVAAFLVMVYAVNIALALMPALTRRDILPFDLAPYDSLGDIFGVALPAFLVVAAMHGRAGVRDLACRCLRWRVGARWYLFALFSMPIGVVLCASVIFGLAPLNVLVQKWPLIFTQVLPQLLLLILFFIVAEEIGWMGFLQARLQDIHGPLKASVIVTVPFSLYHLPSLMVENGLGLAQLHLALGFLGILAILQMFGRVAMMWLDTNTRRSVLLAGLFHSSFDATTSAFGRTFVPGPAETAFLSGFLIPSGVVAMAAVLIVVFTRGRLSYKPDRPPRPAEVAQSGGAPLVHP